MRNANMTHREKEMGEKGKMREISHLCKLDGYVAYDLANNIRGAVQVDNALVDSHLIALPGVRTLTARSSASSVDKNTGGEADGAANLKALLVGTADEVGAN